MNVPPQNEPEYYRDRRKMYSSFLTLIVPEWTIALAAGQWLAARRAIGQFQSLKTKCEDLKDVEWEMKHAFFANMGGFLLQTQYRLEGLNTDGTHRTVEWTPFPIDAEQLFYLIDHGFVPPHWLSLISKWSIQERDKKDSAIRIPNLVQILWFLTDTAGRFAQHLPITYLELTVLAFVYSVIVVSIFWAHKSAEITMPVVIKIDTCIQDILEQAGDAASDPYLRTPLDFVSYREWYFSLLLQNYMNNLQHLHVLLGRHTRPLSALENSFLLPVDWIFGDCRGLSGGYLQCHLLRCSAHQLPHSD